MNKDLSIGILNATYGELLTQHQREIIAQYYDYDLSLQEIAENMQISRQAALDAIKKGSDVLKNYESKLGLVKIKKIIDESVNDISDGKIEEAVKKLTTLFDEKTEN